ncbi:MAG: hypothetical protein ACFFG0_30215 [Candidatus Thorarchaeota archaeon]
MNISDHDPDGSNFTYKNITKFVGRFLLNYYDPMLKLYKLKKVFRLSLKESDKKIGEVEEQIEDIEIFPDISNLIIPFYVAFKKFNPPDIYNGEELIPFDEKDLEFKEILINEFLTD